MNYKEINLELPAKKEETPKLDVTCLVNSLLQPGHKTHTNTSSQREHGPIVRTRIALTQCAAQFVSYCPHKGGL